MTKSRTELLDERLHALRSSSSDLEGVAIISIEGLAIATSLPSNAHEERISAMSAVMLSMGERIVDELQRGNLDQIYIKGDDGFVVLMSIGKDAVLTALAREKAQLGLLLLDMKNAMKDLREII